MRSIATALYFIVAVINFLPALGVLSVERMEAFYGVAIREPNLEILMRHRAVLFSIVGVLLAAAMFRPSLRPLAAAAGFVNMLAFILVAWMIGGYNPPIRRVVLVDAVASVLLAVAVIIDRTSGGPVDG